MIENTLATMTAFLTRQVGTGTMRKALFGKTATHITLPAADGQNAIHIHAIQIFIKGLFTVSRTDRWR